MLYIAKQFGVCYMTVREYIWADPELKESLDRARQGFDESLCDKAENTIEYALEQREDLAVAFGSAKYVLNNKGTKRGYCHPNALIDKAAMEEGMAPAIAMFRELNSAQRVQQALRQSVALCKEAAANQKSSSTDEAESSPPAHNA